MSNGQPVSQSENPVARQEKHEPSASSPGIVSPRAAVIVCSTRAASGERADQSAPIIIQWLQGEGFECLPAWIVADGEPVRAALQEALEAGADLILTTGGTGLTAHDQTPEITLSLLQRQLPGLIQAIVARGLEQTPTAALSRGIAGVAGSSLVVNLPGSRGGIKDGLNVLGPLWKHALDQIKGSHEH